MSFQRINAGSLGAAAHHEAMSMYRGRSANFQEGSEKHHLDERKKHLSDVHGNPSHMTDQHGVRDLSGETLRHVHWDDDLDR